MRFRLVDDITSAWREWRKVPRCGEVPRGRGLGWGFSRLQPVPLRIRAATQQRRGTATGPKRDW
jgi:hypothetical protein